MTQIDDALTIFTRLGLALDEVTSRHAVSRTLVILILVSCGLLGPRIVRVGGEVYAAHVVDQRHQMVFEYVSHSRCKINVKS